MRRRRLGRVVERRDLSREPEPEPEPEQQGRVGSMADGAYVDGIAAIRRSSLSVGRRPGGAARGEGPRVQGCTVALGPGDCGRVGLSFVGVAIDSIHPGGAAAGHVAGAALRPGMVLVSINQLSADQLAYNAIVDLAAGSVRGMSLVFSTGTGSDEHDSDMSDDDREDLVSLEFGGWTAAGQQLGIDFRRVAIQRVDPAGMAAFRAGPALQPGMVLASINQVPTHRLSCQAIRQLTQGDEISGVSMSFDPDPRRQRDDEESAADGDVAAADHDGDDYTTRTTRTTTRHHHWYPRATWMTGLVRTCSCTDQACGGTLLLCHLTMIHPRSSSCAAVVTARHSWVISRRISPWMSSSQTMVCR